MSFNIGERIKDLREEKGISAKYIAIELGFTPSHMSNLEKGKRPISLKTLEKICQVLDIELYEFFLEKSEGVNYLPADLREFVVSPENHDLLRQIKLMKEKGLSNDLIQEWLTSLGNTIENIIDRGVFWAEGMPGETGDYNKEEIVNKLKEKVTDPKARLPWRK